MRKNLNSLLTFRANILASSLLILVLVLGSNLSFAQNSRQSLEKEKKATLKKIQETNKILEQTKAQKNATIGQLNALKEQIKVKEALINNISTEVSSLDNELDQLQDIVSAMESDLTNLKREYALMIYAGYKASHSAYDKLVFIFASRSFDQLVMRLKYLDQYSDFRKEQVEQIMKVQSVLTKKYARIANIKVHKEGLLGEKVVENKSLIVLRDSRNVVVKELSQKEKNLKNELKDNEKAVAKLDNLIADMVRKEIERSRREAEAAERKRLKEEQAKNNTTNTNTIPKKTTSTSKVALTPETQQISNSFASNKGRLIWPVQKGFISQSFGKHPHPVLKHVTVENLGVDIQTSQNEEVRAVFDGKVTAVASVPGMNQVVMIQHGDYFTVYAKLKSVSVTTGQKIKAKEVLGMVYTDKNDISEVQFQIWKNSDKQDPATWLFNR